MKYLFPAFFGLRTFMIFNILLQIFENYKYSLRMYVISIDLIFNILCINRFTIVLLNH